MTCYIGLAEYLWLAEQVTGIDTTTLIKASRVELADSALHAPQAGFGDDDYYPDIYEKAAVLACRLSWNHPLPDGNKRAAWASLVLFIDLNDGRWTHRTLPTSMRLSPRWSPSRLTTSTKHGSPPGFASECSSRAHQPSEYRLDSDHRLPRRAMFGAYAHRSNDWSDTRNAS